MTYLISGILLFLNSISSLLKYKGSILKALLLVMMWILFWGNYYNADYFNYELLYNYISNTGEGFETTQLGFSLIMKITSGIGLEYYQFLMAISLLGLYLIASTVKRYTSKPQLVYVLYFIYPFLLDIVQVRHFIAMSIIVFSFRYLVEDRRLNNLRFVLGTLIACSIHYISIIFLPLLLIKRMKTKRLYTLIFIILVVGIPLAYSNIFLILASYIAPIQKLEEYFLNRARYGFVIQYFIQGGILFLVYYSRRFLEKRKGSNAFVDLIYKTNIYLLILFPLYIINGTFERGFRMIMIPNFILFSLVFIKIKRNEKIMILFFLLLFVIALFVFYIFSSYKYTVFFPIFENNLILE